MTDSFDGSLLVAFPVDLFKILKIGPLRAELAIFQLDFWEGFEKQIKLSGDESPDPFKKFPDRYTSFARLSRRKND